MEKISFLLGSGISLSSKLPDVSTITNELLAYSDIPKNITPLLQDRIKHYKQFLNMLSSYCTALNLNNTYEDLYFYTQSIEKILDTGKCGNFFVKHFIESIKYDLPTLIDKRTLKDQCDLNHALKDFIFQFNIYFRNIVANKLRCADNLEDINRFIKMLLKEEKFNFDLFTLNHDLLLETSLKEQSIYYNTGFGKNNKFSIDNYKDTSSRFNIFKLHGSINWNRKRNDKNKDCIFITDPANPADGHSDPTTNFIMGTFNKYELYSYGIFYDLFHEFRIRLSKTNKLLVCGYGFRDEGVNSVLLEWMEKDLTNKLLIFHNNEDSLRSNSNVFTGWEWDERIANKQIKILKNGFEDIKWEDIKLEINDKRR